MAKLTGANISVHAPLMEPSGIDQQSGRWSEENRILAEERYKTVIDRALELRDKGRVPITLHSANIPGTEWKMVEKDGKRMPVIEKMIVVNRETGQLAPIETKERFYPHYGDKQLEKGRAPNIFEELKTLNHSEWDQSLSPAIFNLENAQRTLESNYGVIKEVYPLIATGQINEGNLTPTEIEAYRRVKNADEYLEQAQLTSNSLFNKAYKYGTEEQREKLKELAKLYREAAGLPREGISDDGKLKFKSEIERQEYILNQINPERKVSAIHTLIEGLKDPGLWPTIYQKVEDFAQDQSSKTFANIAWHAYNSVKGDLSKAPKLGIENVYPGIAFSSGDEMAKLIEASRDQFVNLAKKKGLSEKEAEKAAKEIIGITFDVGHLNIAKKHGFTDKDLVNEAEKFAKYVKHVHLTDNFGYSDSHLPLGMGNVPVKEHLEMLEKQGVLKDATKILETSGWPQHFGSSPMGYNLEGMGSSFYSNGVSPYWNQSLGLQQGYFGGYGLMLPQINYEMQGSGFSMLPSELGGQRMGSQGSRMSGRPME
jgi:hypothetical protein